MGRRACSVIPSARWRRGPPRRTSATSRCSTTTSASGSTSSTSPSCTVTTTGRATPPTCWRRSACSTASDDLPMTFSRGLRQKAAIALAFIRPFELLLVDEPFVGLDRTGRDALLELFERVHADGAALVVATHELTTVAAARAARRPPRRRGRLRRRAGGRRRRRPRRPLRIVAANPRRCPLRLGHPALQFRACTSSTPSASRPTRRRRSPRSSPRSPQTAGRSSRSCPPAATSPRT